MHSQSSGSYTHSSVMVIHSAVRHNTRKNYRSTSFGLNSFFHIFPQSIKLCQSELSGNLMISIMPRKVGKHQTPELSDWVAWNLGMSIVISGKQPESRWCLGMVGIRAMIASAPQHSQLMTGSSWLMNPTNQGMLVFSINVNCDRSRKWVKFQIKCI